MQDDLEDTILSREQIKKAGKVLIEASATDAEKADALEILNWWRRAHAQPLRAVQSRLREDALQFSPSAKSVQRLKRTPSIINKLKNNPSMSLSRMQDIGGCRVILPTKVEVYRLHEFLVSGQSKTPKPVKTLDYIKNPKDSGYKSLHDIVRYSIQSHCDGREHSIEIQIRTRTQHAWATAVEICGVFLGVDLKASKGSEGWLEFFSILSDEIDRKKRDIESFLPRMNKKSLRKLRALSAELNVIERLEAFTVTVNKIGSLKEKKSDYYLLILNPKKRSVEMETFHRGALDQATEKYLRLEKDPELDVVLVSASSIDEIHYGYPNYFADTHEILAVLKAVTSR